MASRLLAVLFLEERKGIMWQETESEVVRLEKILAHNGLTGEKLLEKFRTAPREDVRLAAALRGMFTPGCSTESEQGVYCAYIKRRVLPAAAALMEENRILDLEKLDAALPLTRETVESLLNTARAMGRPEALVWLLEKKQARFGFRDRDFTL